MKTVIKASVLVPLALALMACSAKVESKGGGAPAPGQPEVTIDGNPQPQPQGPTKLQAHKVAGPNIDGTWKSACIDVGFGDGSKLITFIVQGQAVERKIALFTDRYCEVANTKTADPSWKGTFAYAEKLPNDAYDVEYLVEVEMQNGHKAIATQYEALKLADAQTLLISDMVGGFAPFLLLKKQ